MVRLLGSVVAGMACLGVMAEEAVSADVLAERTAQVKLVNAAALTRLADDWAQTPGTDAADVAAVRAFAATAEADKKAACEALAAGNLGPAEALLARQRRLLAAHPLVRDLSILAVKHRGGDPRRDDHPALPNLSCYNNLIVDRNRRASLAVLSGFRDETPQTRDLYTHPGTIHSVDLEWDGRRILFVGADPARDKAWRLFETDADGSPAKTLLPTNFIHEAADCCWLPDGRIVFTSDAGEQGLPCESGRLRMSNSYRLDPANGKVDRLTYDQDSNWYPSVLNDGRIQYVRWEYCDIPHFFSRVVMTMNPDGTRQMGFYGSNDYWPNHIGSPLAIPGDNGKFVAVATGHHAPKSGRLVLFDAERAHAGPKGCVQMMPGWGKPPDGAITDGLYGGMYPRFLQPFPLGRTPADGAGKFFLAAMKASPRALWSLYLVDVFDNVTLLAEAEGWCLNEPIALAARKRPPSIPDRRRENVPYCTMYCGDLYQGEGLKTVPRGTVKSARIFAYHYAFNHTGSHQAVGIESSWDMKYVLGEVPVTEQGGIFFNAPVNTPISIQPLDAEGRAVQLMRSWTVGMPGEYVSCIGCHENPGVTARPLQIVQRAPDTIKPPEGREKPRTWSFLREIQPILQRRCSGCHDKDPCEEVATCPQDKQGVFVFPMAAYPLFTRGDKPNLADFRPMEIQMKNFADDHVGCYSKSYFYLQLYVRRPGPESDYYLQNPLEYHANTSPLVQMLKAGHHGVQLTDAEWRRLYTWIDLNAPFWGTWTDQVEYFRMRGDRGWAGSGRNHEEQQKLLEYSHARRQYGERNFQGFWDPQNDPELDRYTYRDAEKDIPQIAFEPPPAAAAKPAVPQPLPAWTPPTGETRVELQAPGGKLAFRATAPGVWVAETELPLANWLAYEPAHKNGFIDWVGKDHWYPGENVGRGDHPVIRVSFDEVKAYAAWLSEKTGCKLRLPTEAEWEFAARAGTSGDYAWEGGVTNFASVANLSDASVDKLPNQYKVFNYHLRCMDANDGEMTIGSAVRHRYQANAAGLYDMIGNVEEWCVGPNGTAVARGGAFDTIPRLAAFGRRSTYLSWQRVYNVGVRLVLEK